jgi:hypothetical protein
MKPTDSSNQKEAIYAEHQRLDQKLKGFIFDLDGTVYLGEKLIPGADETILTLRNMSIPTRTDEVINSSYVMES